MFGDTIYELLLLLALLLVVLDFFFLTDVLSVVAYALMSYLVVHAINPPFIYGVIIGIVIWVSMGFLHYAIFKTLIQKICNQLIAPSRIEVDPLSRYVGKETKVVVVEGKKMLRLEGDLIAFENSENFKEGEIVKVASFADGIIKVS